MSKWVVIAQAGGGDLLKDALGTGWLIPVVVALIPATITLITWVSRLIANTWRKPLLEEQELRKELESENKELKDDLKVAEGERNKEQMMRMFYEHQYGSQEKELERWRSGQYRSSS